MGDNFILCMGLKVVVTVKDLC